MGSARRDRGYLKRQTRDARRALTAACVEKGRVMPPTHRIRTTPTCTYACVIIIYNYQFTFLVSAPKHVHLTCCFDKIYISIKL